MEERVLQVEFDPSEHQSESLEAHRDVLYAALDQDDRINEGFWSGDCSRTPRPRSTDS